MPAHPFVTASPAGVAEPLDTTPCFGLNLQEDKLFHLCQTNHLDAYYHQCHEKPAFRLAAQQPTA